MPTKNASPRLLALVAVVTLAPSVHPSTAHAAEGDTTWIAHTNLEGYKRAGSRTAVSADGRYVAFESDTLDLGGKHYFLEVGTAPDRPLQRNVDVYVWDRQTDGIVRVSWGGLNGGPYGPVGTDCYAPSISADGRYVAFVAEGHDVAATAPTTVITRIGTTTADGQAHVYVADLRTDRGYASPPESLRLVDWSRTDGQTGCILVAGTSCNGGNGASLRPAISADGRYVAFDSNATNLLGPPPLGLVPGTSASATDLAPGQPLELSLVVPADGLTPRLTVELGSSAVPYGPQAQVLLRRGEPPTQQSYDRWVNTTSGSATIDLSPSPSDPPTNGEGTVWYGMVTAWSWLPQVTVRFDVDAPSLQPSTPVFGLAGGPGSLQTSSLYVPPDTTSLALTLAGGEGDADLYLRQGQPPTVGQWDQRSRGLGTDETLVVDAPAPGIWYVGLLGATSYSGAHLLAELAPTAPPAGGDPPLEATARQRVYVRDLQTGALDTVTPSADGDSWEPSISGDGALVTFTSLATNLSWGDDGRDRADVFLWARWGGISQLSRTTGGDVPNGASFGGTISRDGQWIAFSSLASNLLASELVHDRNGASDVFLVDRWGGSLAVVSAFTQCGTVSSPYPHFTCWDRTGDLASDGAAINDDGTYVLFNSTATNLVPCFADTNRRTDVLRFERSRRRLSYQSARRGFYGPVGEALSGRSEWPAVSADGRWAVFDSSAGNVTDAVAALGATSRPADVFVSEGIGALTSPGATGGCATLTGSWCGDQPTAVVSLGNYYDLTIDPGQSLTLSPSYPPTTSYRQVDALRVTPSISGVAITGDPVTGRLQITVAANAAPTTQLMTVRVTETCGATTTRAFRLTVRSLPRAPAAPTSLTLLPTDLNHVTVGWQDQSDNEAGFEVQYSLDSGSTWQSSVYTPASAVSWVIYRVGIVNNRFARYRVRATNAYGSSAWLTGSLGSG